MRRQGTTSALSARLRPLGPAMAQIPLAEAGRAALGVALGLAVCAALVLPGDPSHGRYMVAPLGASAVLVFGVPNSPLAQPWSVLAGNTVSALVAVAVLRLVPGPLLALALSVGLAFLAMALLRAMHPPGGAVALTAALSPDAVRELGFGFALAPVALGTLALVLLAVPYARLTGRRYPFRQPAPDRTDAPAAQRGGLSADDLTAILRDFRQSTNLGAEDLARLIAAAEQQAARHRLGALTCADIMSRDLVTVGPGTALARVAEIFRRHAFTSLPVVDEGGRLLGMIFQIHLIRRGAEDARRLNRSFLSGLARLLDRGRAQAPAAGDVMSVAVPRATTDMPVAALLPLLADGATDAVPVVRHGVLVGIVTQTDLLAALTRQMASAAAAPATPASS